MNFIYLKIATEELFNGINSKFIAYQQALYDQAGVTKDCVYLEQYFQKKGISLGSDDISQSDPLYAHYPKVRRIEKMFLDFVSENRESFKFSAPSLGRVIITEEQLTTLVPSDWPLANGRTFEQYCKNIEEIDGLNYATMGTWSGYPLANGVPEDQDDFWRFYDYFGKESVLLAYEFYDLPRPEIVNDL